MKQLVNENSLAGEVYKRFSRINHEETSSACDIILGFPDGTHASVEDILVTGFHYQVCVKYCSSRCAEVIISLNSHLISATYIKLCHEHGNLFPRANSLSVFRGI